jgi:diguanylate cyclase (GGDEF)-like protein
MMLDLDKFKQINDGLGHHAGDEVLRITANRLVEIFRKSDTVARLGGDEFVALLPELSDPIVAEILAAKVVAALALPISFAGRELQISASVGVCIAAPDELDAHALMKTADEALYRAKARGRNCFEFQATGLVATQEPESSLARASDLVRRLTSEEDCPPVDPQSVGFAEQSGHASSKRA